MIRRLKMIFANVKGRSDDLSRRVTVENYLWGASAGRNPLPDKAKCKELAIKLGVPQKYQKHGGEE